MRKLFRSQFKVTQGFGVNPEYYKQFGLKAHEGIDLIPTGTVWDVFALEDGIVVKDEDNARSGAYGKYVTIWSPTIKKATQYCHLASNSVSNGQQIKKGDVIGVMGATGNTTGAHVHLNLFQTDDNGVRLNKDNGYLGGVDPLPFLNEVTEASDQQEIIDELRVARDKNWNLYQSQIEENKKLQIFNDDLVSQLSTEKENSLNLAEDLRNTEQKLGQCLNITGELNETDKKTTEQLIEEQKKNKDLMDENAILKKKVDEMKEPKEVIVYKNLPKGFFERLKILFS